MITVSILINAQPIFTRSARNNNSTKNGKTKYVTDAGDIIWHKRDDGAIDLAIAMLKTIKESMTLNHNEER